MSEDPANAPAQFFSWWNSVIAADLETSAAEFAEYARIVTNDVLVCSGVAEIAHHFMDVRRRYECCEVKLPLRRTLASGRPLRLLATFASHFASATLAHSGTMRTFFELAWKRN